MKHLLWLGVWLGLSGSAAWAQVSPDETVKRFEVADGLEASVWAAEPMLANPTDIDIDSRGRVWVCEGANYRNVITRPEGDRIVILEDTDHDGKADSQKVFVQDTKLKSPLGVCVMGNKVYVSLSPNILVYTIDESGDKPAGPPEVWMTGFEGAEHDHGVHAVMFGPDGRIYFNSGNAGTDVKEPFKWGPAAAAMNAKPVVDSTGSDVPRGKMWRGGERKKGVMGYMEGMAFRTNADGTGFETLGYNFRNNYELCVDSFGTVWQSDNDDDGNEGVRINYVIEGGNFGYHGPQGHDWMRDQSAFPDQTKQQAHWHQKWPGVVPNMLHTGGGSPTGICIYEGELLPERFRGALIHCDAGPNVVRAYLPKPSKQVPIKKFDEDGTLQGPDRDGAGYKAEVINVLKGKDSWFRPSDVCVAPDGSVFVSDWYDPGVGGHQTADQPKSEKPDWHKLRGRIYRITPKGANPETTKLDLTTVDGQIKALKSPNLATRYMAFTHLKDNPDAEAALVDTFSKDPNLYYKARALWALAAGKHGDVHIAAARYDKEPDLRIVVLRAARQRGYSVVALANAMSDDHSPRVRREVALAMNYEPAEKAVPILVKLLNKYDGEDRWYLEAIGIGANGKEDEVLKAWEAAGTNKDGKTGELIRWRLKKELPGQVRLDEHIQMIGEWWDAGPFDLAADDAPDMSTDLGPDATPAAINPNATLKGVGGRELHWTRVETTPYEGAVAGVRWVDFEEICEKADVNPDHTTGYFATTVVSPAEQSATLLIGSNDGCVVWLNGKQVLHAKGVRALKFPQDQVNVPLKGGANVVFVKLRNQRGASGLAIGVQAEKQRVAFSSDAPGSNSAESATANAATQSAPGAKSKDGTALPPVAELAKLTGDAAAGESVFANASGANCISCHQIGTKGQMLGPPLTTIGQKLSKAQLYESILTPSAGILMGYENWVVKTKKGETVSGLKTSDTPDGITIKDTQGKYHDIDSADIARQGKQKVSIMPENLSQTMTRQELVDLVEYLSTLRNKS